MGLKFPENLNDWKQWQEKRDSLRRAKNLIKDSFVRGASEQTELSGFLYIRGYKPEVLIVLDSSSPTTLKSLVEPIKYITNSVAVWAPHDISQVLPSSGWHVQKILGAPVLSDVRLVLATGHYLPFGSAAYEFSQSTNAEYVVVQHGLMTPYAPPLPAHSTLFAFSQADAEFWISGRNDIRAEIVGSQLFYEAHTQEQVAPQNIAKQPVFLGQMHGAELSRTSFAQAGYQFCRNHRAIYRPHPSEKDKLSLITHKLWAKKGIEIDSSGTPLNQLNNPVVSVFSTGVLEAAMRGIPAWVYHPNPPAWLVEFWERYGMSQWGGSPTTAPAQPAIEPAKKIAEVIAQTIAQ